jgi:hypothetical protein
MKPEQPRGFNIFDDEPKPKPKIESDQRIKFEVEEYLSDGQHPMDQPPFSFVLDQPSLIPEDLFAEGLGDGQRRLLQLNFIRLAVCFNSQQDWHITKAPASAKSVIRKIQGKYKERNKPKDELVRIATKVRDFLVEFNGSNPNRDYLRDYIITRWSMAAKARDEGSSFFDDNGRRFEEGARFQVMTYMGYLNQQEALEGLKWGGMHQDLRNLGYQRDETQRDELSRRGRSSKFYVVLKSEGLG